MAQLPGSFNADKHEDMNDFTAFEVHNAVAQIVKSEMIETKNKNGHYLKLDFKILAGKFKGSHVWTNLNLDNPNDKAVEIANKELATICRAIGKVAINDSQELHGIPILINTGIEKSADYPDKTKITMYKPYSEIPEVVGDEPKAKAKAEVGEAKEGADAGAGKKKPWE